LTLIAVVHNFVRNALASLVVTPAKAGVQNILKYLDSGVRRNDGTEALQIGQNFWHLLRNCLEGTNKTSATGVQ
jgi:hypothetical protein